MDYGFAPGQDAQDLRARLLFALREGTTLIQRSGLSTVRGFIQRLQTAIDVQRPIDNVLLGAHANSEGILFLTIFPKQSTKSTQFETLEESLADPDKSIQIPDDLLGQTSTDPITHFVHFKGCNIGKAQPFVEKMKEAFGNRVNVTAPKHFHGLTESRPYGIFETMAFEFKIQRPTKLPDRQSIIDAFAQENFTFLDGTPVSNDDLERWVPRRHFRSTLKEDVTEELGTTIGKKSTVKVRQEFRVHDTSLGFTWTITFPSASDVPSPADRQAAFEDSVSADPKFATTHPFPYFVRVGFQSLSDFFAGYTWKHQKKGRRLVTTGSRVVYVIVTPIEVSSTAGSDVFFNFHPNVNSSHSPIINLLESDDRFFLTV